MIPDNTVILNDGTVLAEIDGILIELNDLDEYYDYIS